MTDEQIDLDNEQAQIDGELGLGDLGGKWVKNPGVGQSIVFTAKAFAKQTNNLKFKNPQTGQTVDSALSSTRDKGEPYKIECHTMDGSIYSISNWEVWGKLQKLWGYASEEAGMGKSMSPQGLTFFVKHTLNGMDAANKGKECYVVALKRKDNKFYVLTKEGKLDEVSTV